MSVYELILLSVVLSLLVVYTLLPVKWTGGSWYRGVSNFPNYIWSVLAVYLLWQAVELALVAVSLADRLLALAFTAGVWTLLVRQVDGIRRNNRRRKNDQPKSAAGQTRDTLKEVEDET